VGGSLGVRIPAIRGIKRKGKEKRGIGWGKVFPQRREWGKDEPSTSKGG